MLGSVSGWVGACGHPSLSGGDITTMGSGYGVPRVGCPVRSSRLSPQLRQGQGCGSHTLRAVAENSSAGAEVLVGWQPGPCSAEGCGRCSEGAQGMRTPAHCGQGGHFLPYRKAERKGNRQRLKGSML